MSTLRDVWVLPGVARRILLHLVPNPWGRVLVARLMLALTARALVRMLFVSTVTLPTRSRLVISTGTRRARFRVAMLAAAGMIHADKWHPLFNGKLSSNPLLALVQVRPRPDGPGPPEIRLFANPNEPQRTLANPSES